MKSTEYEVTYNNGKTEYFYCGSFKECIVTAMYYAYSKCFDERIQNISDGKQTITNIVVGFKFSK